MKKLLSIVLVIQLMLAQLCFVGAAAEEEQFKDVQPGYWAYDEIQYFYQAGVVNGIGDEYFAPDAQVTREQFAKLLSIVFDKTDYEAAEETFSDVLPDRWSYPYIESVKDFLTGYFPADDKPFFNPSAKAMREDIAYALVKIAGWEQEEEADEAVFDRFSDSEDVSPGLKKYLGIAISRGLIQGDDEGKIRPADGITRAETVVLLFRAMKYPVTEPPVTSAPAPSEEPTESTEPTASAGAAAAPTASPETSKEPEATENPTPTRRPASRAETLELTNVVEFSDYTGEDVYGAADITWTPGETDAFFAARIVTKDDSGVTLTVIKLDACTEATEDSISGLFTVTVNDVVKSNKTQGEVQGLDTKTISLVTADGLYDAELSTETREYDRYNRLAYIGNLYMLGTITEMGNYKGPDDTEVVVPEEGTIEYYFETPLNSYYRAKFTVGGDEYEIESSFVAEIGLGDDKIDMTGRFTVKKNGKLIAEELDGDATVHTEVYYQEDEPYPLETPIIEFRTFGEEKYFLRGIIRD